MNAHQPIDRAVVTSLIANTLSDITAQHGQSPSYSIDDSTPLVGAGAVIDSLGLVTLIVDLEQRFSDEFGISLVLADDRAMSQERSPFRTVGSLSSYISQVIGSANARG